MKALFEKPTGQQALQAYIERIERDDFEGTALLAGADVVRWNEAMRSHPTLKLLGGVVLDDPGTSNHHVLLTAEPLAGAVLYLNHDGDTRVVFASVEAFLEATKQARSGECDVEDFHPRISPSAPDQKSLTALIRQLLASSEDDDIAVQLIPSLDLSDLDLLRELALHGNFFIAEAIAIEIAKRPAEQLGEIAALCAGHAHPQAANAGKRALATGEIRRI